MGPVFFWFTLGGAPPSPFPFPSLAIGTKKRKGLAPVGRGAGGQNGLIDKWGEVGGVGTKGLAEVREICTDAYDVWRCKPRNNQV